jgi:hypothetical protein
MAGRVGGTPVSLRLRAPHPTRLCAVFAIRDGATSAEIYDVTVAGYAGTPIEPAAAGFTLTNEEFNPADAGADCSAWFTNLPPGLTAAAPHGIPGGSSDAIVLISGTPSAEAHGAISATIPASAVRGGAAIPVDENPDATIDIKRRCRRRRRATSILRGTRARRSRRSQR